MTQTHKQQLHAALDHAIKTGSVEPLVTFLSIMAGSDPEMRDACNLLVLGVDHAREKFSKYVGELQILCDGIIQRAEENEKQGVK